MTDVVPIDSAPAASETQTVLQKFLRAPENTVSREIMFYNRLYYDLKMATAQAGYALTMFTPEVDRDSFDLILDDGDSRRHLQLKTKLDTAATGAWSTKKRFVRPDLDSCDDYMLVPADSGLNGAFVVIDINDSHPLCPVSYRFTDYAIIRGFMMRLWLEVPRTGPAGPGKPPTPRADTARELIEALHTGSGGDRISVPKSMFVRVKSIHGLLALLGIHGTLNAARPAYEVSLLTGFEAEASGIPARHIAPELLRRAEHHATEIFDLMDEPDLAVFKAPPPGTFATSP